MVTPGDKLITGKHLLYNVVFVADNGSNTKAAYTRNSSGDEIANVNFLYHDIVHACSKIQ